ASNKGSMGPQRAQITSAAQSTITYRGQRERSRRCMPDDIGFSVTPAKLDVLLAAPIPSLLLFSSDPEPMHRIYFAFAAALLPMLGIAQETTGARPFSFTHGLPAHDGPTAAVATFDQEEAAADDAWRAAAGKLPLYA